MGGGAGYRKDDGRLKRGDNRRQNIYMDNSNAWKTTKTKQMQIDTSKFKAVTNKVSLYV